MGTLEEKECLYRARATCLENIRTLNVWGSNLYDVSIVRKMVNIEVLNLSVNNITGLCDLAYCPRLKEIYLRKNKILNISELKYLKNLPNLQVLWLSDNPCTEQDNYRETILKNLPNLKKLDSDPVTEDDLIKARNKGTNVSGEGDLPVYDGLDLDKTLTVEMMKRHFEQFPVKEEKEKVTDQKVSNDVELNTSSHAEMKNEQLSHSETQENVDNTSTEERQLETPENLNREQPLTATSTRLNSLSSTPARSNTLSAVLLLLEELNEQELHEVKHQAEVILSSKVESLPVSESVLVD